MFGRFIKAIRDEFAIGDASLFGPDCPPGSPFRDLVSRLRKAGVRFSSGLPNAEIDGIADLFGFPLPPDLREFWSTAVPDGKSWWDWRRLSWSRREMAERIAEELRHHVESGDFWLDTWGPRPKRKAEARAIVANWAAKGPALLPLFGHRYAVCEPELPDTPVLSIYGSDWIYYGWNIASWLEQEFLGKDLFKLQPWPPHQPIGQWQDVLDFDCRELPPAQWLD